MYIKLLVAIVTSFLAFGTAHAQSGQSDDVYTHSVTIKRPPVVVWNAIVTRELVNAYYFAPLSSNLTGVGQKFSYGTAEQPMIVGEVLEFNAPDTLKHSFRFAGPDQPGSVVTYSLAAVGAKTELKVVHEGYKKDSQPYADIAGGWPIILEGLKVKLEEQ